MEERVILVDKQDREVGMDTKLAVHTSGKLHRAISVFVFDGEDNLLLQRRAETKYHSAGLWSNTCCGHPRPGENTHQAAHRRLREEMGVECPLHHVLSFVYQSDLGNGLSEHEYDHVFVGRIEAEGSEGGTGKRTPVPNPDEVAEWCWLPVELVVKESAAHPERYTAWFGIALGKLLALHPFGATVGSPPPTHARREGGGRVNQSDG
ncbi:MAG: isopentenyl-diphosphate Delta-isomerase [Gemmatimonadetes bacterium]|nr:isopentenyl-diphosphate Delta-isomerase [Gemmatimonadota bacterium]